MYKNIGKKLMSVASIFCILEIIASVICGIIMIEEIGPLSILIIVGGIGVAWLSNAAMYAMGNLVENTAQTNEYLEKINRKMHSVNQSVETELEEQIEDEDESDEYYYVYNESKYYHTKRDCPGLMDIEEAEMSKYLRTDINRKKYFPCPYCNK